MWAYWIAQKLNNYAIGLPVQRRFSDTQTESVATQLICKGHHMATSPQYIAFISEQLAQVGRVSTRRMFGCMGFYVEGVFCAIVNRDNECFLRTGPNNIADFIAAEAPQFMDTMPYYQVPEQVLESGEDMAAWTAKARAAALAAQSKKPKKPRPPMGN